MKLLRVGPLGNEKVCALDNQNKIRDLSPFLNDLNPDTINFKNLNHLKKINLEEMKLLSPARIGSPVNRPGDFFAIGLNYRAHADKTKSEIKNEPIVFNKSTGCILGPNDNVLKPKNSQKLDHEIEVAIVIGKKGKNIKKSSAMDYIFGFCICNDYSEREWQKERNGQWVKGKSIAGNLGPILVTRDEIKEPYNLNLSLKLNGKERQKGNTKELIFDFEYLVSYLSEFLTLNPGSIITTGTPAGTIMEDKNPEFLKNGDELVLNIDCLGEQKQLIVSE
tara:strand:+ start:375 stop:1208 length:834 start_codon:yes stop_codon:yes gene_type:complete